MYIRMKSLYIAENDAFKQNFHFFFGGGGELNVAPFIYSSSDLILDYKIKI